MARTTGGDSLREVESSPPLELVVRAARADDLEAIVALFVVPDEANKKTDMLTSPLDPAYRRALELIGDDPDNRVWVAVRSLPRPMVVGVFQLTIVQYLANRGGRVATIENVVVDPEARGSGVGSFMMRFAIDEARRRGCFRVQLTSHLVRERAHRFYERLGFVATHQGFKLKL